MHEQMQHGFSPAALREQAQRQEDKAKDLYREANSLRTAASVLDRLHATAEAERPAPGNEGDTAT